MTERGPHHYLWVSEWSIKSGWSQDLCDDAEQQDKTEQLLDTDNISNMHIMPFKYEVTLSLQMILVNKIEQILIIENRRVRELLDLVKDKQKIMLESSEDLVVPYVLDFHKRAKEELTSNYNKWVEQERLWIKADEWWNSQMPENLCSKLENPELTTQNWKQTLGRKRNLTVQFPGEENRESDSNASMDRVICKINGEKYYPQQL
ncbi:hypothetical protein WISP_88116 [Willisornis vidua]|uniref:Uncharacterized protein n=1 Tax=Willisornis vidua TaxID=1566151 RepID=A0ABQ9D878_9PASS|nr:hypothetical protein WISP_88116 [Willisornis vidua]